MNEKSLEQENNFLKEMIRTYYQPEIEELNNIIKEVREYIERYREQKEKLQGVMLCSSKLLETLDKER